MTGKIVKTLKKWYKNTKKKAKAHEIVKRTNQSDREIPKTGSERQREYREIIKSDEKSYYDFKRKESIRCRKYRREKQIAREKD